MQNYDKAFTHPVSEAGFPGMLPIIETLKGTDTLWLPLSTLRHVYWNLKALTITYTFEKQSKRHERHFTLTIDEIPAMRANHAPRCAYHNQPDVEALSQDDYGLILNFSKIFKNPQGEWGIKITAWDGLLEPLLQTADNPFKQSHTAFNHFVMEALKHHFSEEKIDEADPFITVHSEWARFESPEKQKPMIALYQKSTVHGEKQSGYMVFQYQNKTRHALFRHPDCKQSLNPQNTLSHWVDVPYFQTDTENQTLIIAHYYEDDEAVRAYYQKAKAFIENMKVDSLIQSQSYPNQIPEDELLVDVWIYKHLYEAIGLNLDLK